MLVTIYKDQFQQHIKLYIDMVWMLFYLGTHDRSHAHVTLVLKLLFSKLHYVERHQSTWFINQTYANIFSQALCVGMEKYTYNIYRIT